MTEDAGTDPSDSLLHALEAECRTVLGGPIDQIDDLAHGTRMSVTAQVARVRSGSTSAVVKVLSDGSGNPEWRGSYEPTHSRYWRREPRLYAEGLPAPYGEAGIRAPALLAAFERPLGIALWLEGVDELPGANWTAVDFEPAAYRFGAAQGPYLRGARAFGEFPWSRKFLPTYLDSWSDIGWATIHDDELWAHPIIRELVSPALRRRLVQLCETRHELVRWSGLLPQTICHHDIWPNNVFAGPEHTTVIDWAFAGFGQIGADVGNLITDCCGDLLHPTELLPEFDASTTTGYVDGLRDVGWRGDHRLARLGMCVMAAKWSWLVPHTLRGAAQGAHHVYGGRSVTTEHLIAARTRMLTYLCGMADEAQQLGRALLG